MFVGGIADKLGNRYEAKWLVRHLLDVVGGRAEWLRYEGIDRDSDGFEFAVGHAHSVQWHQTKVNAPHGNWTINALKREKVLSAFKKRLAANERDRCVFVSQDPAKDLRSLSEKAAIASSARQFQETLARSQSDDFTELQAAWAVDADTAYAWLKRSEFRTLPQSEIEAQIETFAELYFATGPNVFSLLREFVETRFNKKITTDYAREEISAEGRLTLKSWTLDTTLPERLSQETAAYLATYLPFGVGGSRISRAEARTLTDAVKDPNGPLVILLTGVAGSGKSAVVREFIEQLRDSEIPHLAFRIDQHLDCTSPKALGRAIAGRDESPVVTLKGAAPDQLSVLIVDQVDAVSEVSGRNGAVKQAILRLVDDIRTLGSVRLVIACRTFDLESDERLKALKNISGIKHVDVPLLTWETEIEPVLISKSVDTAPFSKKQRDLLCLPLHLAIFLETSDIEERQFGSRNDLFARLLEKKGRSIRVGRQLAWDPMAPLANLAEWMSDHQRLDAPEDVLANYGGSLDILSSEGLIVRTRGHAHFFHESFFDYVFARTFAGRQQSLTDFLLSSEQHLFRRTQVRQILETLRQSDKERYLRELSDVLNGNGIRHHIKTAIAQWMNSLSTPLDAERDIILAFDNTPGRFPQLLRYAIYSSPGWFDALCANGWVSRSLASGDPERVDATLWWLSGVAGQRPNDIALLLDQWWGGDSARGEKLLAWFGFVQRQQPDAAVIELCARVIRSQARSLFGSSRTPDKDLLFHTWLTDRPASGEQILRAYFDAWFDVNSDQHPFGREQFGEREEHSFGDLAKKAPELLVRGSIAAFARSIDIVARKQADGERDSSFSYRVYSGHHFGEDAFLAAFRSSLKDVAARSPVVAREYLDQLDPGSHEVCVHLWLETIAANGAALSDLLPAITENPYLLEAGWDGAEWKSFSDAAREALPHLPTEGVRRVERRILSHWPELKGAIELAARIKLEGESAPWRNRSTVISLLNQSGRAQWFILEEIGETNLTELACPRLAQLRRKFPKENVPEPRHNEAYWVRSPIHPDKAAQMSDSHWLQAIVRYESDRERRRGRDFVEGGADQLARELQNLTKQQPNRFARLLSEIPHQANQTYVTHILWGLAEAEEVDDQVLLDAILNAHSRPGRPYGKSIAQICEKHPYVATHSGVFDALIWYLEHGEADDDGAHDAVNAQRELITVDDLITRGGRLHVRGINGERGAAAEALGAVLWQSPDLAERAWPILERRADEEPLISVRCCLIKPVVPLYNSDKQRCAALVERLSRMPGCSSDWVELNFAERAWIQLAFPHVRLSRLVRRASVRCAHLLERLLRRHRSTSDEDHSAWWAPLLTHQGVYLLTFLIHFVPVIGKALLCRLSLRGDELCLMSAAWHVLRLSFQEDEFTPLADAVLDDGVVYRRLAADLASKAVIHDEYRYRAESVLEASFDDVDDEVCRQAADVFHNISPKEFQRFKRLSERYLESRAFEVSSFTFFHAIEKAECRVDDLVICASEALINDIARNGNVAGRRAMELHQLEDLLQREYASSEGEPKRRRRLLDLIDKMLLMELSGTERIVETHQR